MKSIYLTGTTGDKTHIAEISQPNGAGGMYFILVDNFFNGMLNRVNDEWRINLNRRSQLTSDDLMLMIESIVQAES